MQLLGMGLIMSTKLAIAAVEAAKRLRDQLKELIELQERLSLKRRGIRRRNPVRGRLARR
jgi:hypothetical protein